VAQTTEGSGSALKVLVADDDDDLRASIVNALRADGYMVLEARDGEETLAFFHKAAADPSTRPDVILADVRMPKLSGLGVLVQLRRAGVRLPVVMMTAFYPDSVDIVAKRLGARSVLRKPFDLGALRAAVTAARAIA
jgi:DNA-binding response OmpR family regulator